MKNKKIGKIIALMILISLAMPMVFASDIQEFFKDMKAHPNNYYILYNLTNQPAIKLSVDNFANYFGVIISDTEIPNKNPMIIKLSGEQFALNYSYDVSKITSVETFTTLETGKNINYTLLSLEVEEGYYDYLLNLSQLEIDKIDLNHDGNISLYETFSDDLNITLNYLLENYNTIEKEVIKLANRQVIDERPITCVEFNDSDYSVWYKDEYLHQGEVLEDVCFDTYYYNGINHQNILAELTCFDTGYVSYYFWTCPRGCSDGRCIYTPFFLVYQYSMGDTSYDNFYSAIDAWLNA